MNLYDVSASGHPAIPVFAETYGNAVELFLAFWFFDEGGELPDIDIKQRNLSWPGLNAKHLEAALAANISGIGRYDLAKGWTILPPNQAAVGDVQ